MMLTIALMAALAAPAPAQGDAPSTLRRFALVAGANDGGQDRVRLRYAASDAAAVARVLEELGGVAAADRVVVLEPDVKALEAAFGELAERMRAAKGAAQRLELFIYYSGHSDEDGLLLRGQRLSYGELKQLLQAAPADVRVAVLDSCSSGALTRKKGGRARAPFLSDASAAVRGHAFLTSSSEHEAAQESDRLKGSFFTHFLLSGLRGAADVSSDGRVTLNEAYQFAFAETLARTERTQAGPQHAAYDIQLAGTGDLVLTDLRATSASLVLDETVGGRIFVRDAEQRLVAELFKPAGRIITLGLAPGTYAVTVDERDALLATEVVLSDGGRTPLTREGLKPLGREVAMLRGDAEQPVSPPVEPPANEVLTLPGGRQLQVVPFSFTIVPGLSTAPAGDVVKNFSLNLLLGDTARLYGMELGFGWNRVRDEARGLQAAIGGNSAGKLVGAQLAVGVNHSEGPTTGLQAASGFNVSQGRLRGMQLAAGFNVAAGPMTGLQGAAGFNVNDGPVVGSQLAAGFNWTEGSFRGVQAAAGFNWTAAEVHGVQAAAGINVAGPLRGIQAAAGLNWADGVNGLQIAVVNIADDVEGSQVGIVNIADKVKGMQLGIVNVSDDIDGVPIGLFNFVRDGQLHLEAFSTNSEPYNLGLRFGSKHVYTLLTAGLPHRGLRYREGMRYFAGLGIGVHATPSERLFFDVDVVVGSENDIERGETVSGIGRLRLAAGWQIMEHLAVFGGPVMNVMIADDYGPMSPTGENAWRRRQYFLDDVRVRTWPSLMAGVQL